MRLHLYFARRFLRTFGGTLVVVGLFATLIELVEQLRQLGDEIPFADVAQMALLRAPDTLYQLLPLILILSAMALMLGLARSSELVATRAAGRSGIAALTGPLLAALLIGLVALSMGNPIVAATMKKYRDLKTLHRSGGVATFSVGPEGLWLRQAGPIGQTVIRASHASGDARQLADVTFLVYAPGKGPIERIEADRARLGTGAWHLENAKIWSLGDFGNPEDVAEERQIYVFPATVSPEELIETFGAPDTISIWNMRGFIDRLTEAGLTARRHVVRFQFELAQPLFLLAMVLIGAAFTMRHVRFGGTGVAVLASVLLGFGLHYVRNFARILGENGQLDPLIAGWAPPVAAVLLGIGLVLRAEDG